MTVRSRQDIIDGLLARASQRGGAELEEMEERIKVHQERAKVPQDEKDALHAFESFHQDAARALRAFNTVAGIEGRPDFLMEGDVDVENGAVGLDNGSQYAILVPSSHSLN